MKQNITSAPKQPNLKINVNIFQKEKKSKYYLNKKINSKNIRWTEAAIVKMLSTKEFCYM